MKLVVTHHNIILNLTITGKPTLAIVEAKNTHYYRQELKYSWQYFAL